MVDMDYTDYEALARVPKEQLREMVLNREQLLGLQEATRKQGRCGSFQTKDGLPCRRRPKTGYPVCFEHGERAPQTMKVAERLLAAARIPAISWILTELEQAQEPTCNECGYPVHTVQSGRRYDMLSYRLLDRVGMGPGKTLTIQTSSTGEADVLASEMTDEEREQARGLLGQLKELKECVRLRLARHVAREALALPAGGGGSDDPSEGGDARGGVKDGQDTGNVENLEHRDDEPGDQS